MTQVSLLKLIVFRGHRNRVRWLAKERKISQARAITFYNYIVWIYLWKILFWYPAVTSILFFLCKCFLICWVSCSAIILPWYEIINNMVLSLKTLPKLRIILSISAGDYPLWVWLNYIFAFDWVKIERIILLGTKHSRGSTLGVYLYCDKQKGVKSYVNPLISSS